MWGRRMWIRHLEPRCRRGRAQQGDARAGTSERREDRSGSVSFSLQPVPRGEGLSLSAAQPGTRRRPCPAPFSSPEGAGRVLPAPFPAGGGGAAEQSRALGAGRPPALPLAPPPRPAGWLAVRTANMAAEAVGRDTLPEHWSYGVCRDGRVFFIE